MTENLRLTLVQGRTLKTTDTDVLNDWFITNDDETKSTETKWIDTDYFDRESVEIVRSYNGPGVDGSNTVNTYDGDVQQIGTFFNYYTATAKSGGWDTAASTNIKNSVCPRGWTLPSYSGARSFNNLLSIYSIENGSQESADKLRSSPISMVYSGHYDAGEGRIFSQGENGHWWTATTTPSGETYAAWSFAFDTSLTINLQYDFKAFGFPIRCVVK